jgi:Mrp family chromosome partitioning ATPase
MAHCSQSYHYTFQDGQIHIFQVVPLTAAVIVTTPQKLAFIDVAKGVRMFSKLKVCISVIQVLHSPFEVKHVIILDKF